MYIVEKTLQTGCLQNIVVIWTNYSWNSRKTCILLIRIGVNSLVFYFSCKSATYWGIYVYYTYIICVKNLKLYQLPMRGSKSLENWKIPIKPTAQTSDTNTITTIFCDHFLFYVKIILQLLFEICTCITFLANGLSYEYEPKLSVIFILSYIHCVQVLYM